MQCSRCNGNGQIRVTIPCPDQDKYSSSTCAVWHFKEKECPNCDGTGELVGISLKNYRLFKHLIRMQNAELELFEQTQPN